MFSVCTKVLLNYMYDSLIQKREKLFVANPFLQRGATLYVQHDALHIEVNLDETIITTMWEGKKLLSIKESFYEDKVYTIIFGECSWKGIFYDRIKFTFSRSLFKQLLMITTELFFKEKSVYSVKLTYPKVGGLVIPIEGKQKFEIKSPC